VLPGTVDGVALLEDPHDESSPPDGETPADALAVKQDDADGVPAPFPPALFAAESSETVDGVPPPHALLRLTFVGAPGAASAFKHVDAFVGSWADPRSPADAPAAPVAREMIVACTPESDVQTRVWLVSALAVGPLVCGAGAPVPGAAGLVVVVVATGALALVPGALAVVDELDVPFGCGAVPLEAVTGSLDETAAGPTVPPLAVAVPPATGWSVLGRTSGWSNSRGSSANAAVPPRWSSAITARIWKSFRMSFLLSYAFVQLVEQLVDAFDLRDDLVHRFAGLLRIRLEQMLRTLDLAADRGHRLSQL